MIGPLSSQNMQIDATTSPGLLRRLGAIFYDAILLIGLMMLLTALLLALTEGKAITAGNWYYRGLLLSVIAVFFTWFWSHGGQTLGMRAWRLKLLTHEHETPGYKECLTRLIFATISIGILGLGFLWVLIDPENRSWHDRWSKTRLVTLP